MNSGELEGPTRLDTEDTRDLLDEPTELLWRRADVAELRELVEEDRVRHDRVGGVGGHCSIGMQAGCKREIEREGVEGTREEADTGSSRRTSFGPAELCLARAPQRRRPCRRVVKAFHFAQRLLH